MSLASALAAVNAKMQSIIPGLNADTCKIGDESVFNYIQTNTVADNVCCVIEYSGLKPNHDRREFSSYTIIYDIAVNLFFRIVGNNDASALSSARSAIDLMLAAFASDPTIGGSVLYAALSGANPFLQYNRGQYVYILLAVELQITENII